MGNRSIGENDLKSASSYQLHVTNLNDVVHKGCDRTKMLECLVSDIVFSIFPYLELRGRC